jgi:hypothetical protein
MERIRLMKQALGLIKQICYKDIFIMVLLLIIILVFIKASHVTCVGISF